MKAISPMVATVIIIGLAVGVGAAIYAWSSGMLKLQGVRQTGASQRVISCAGADFKLIWKKQCQLNKGIVGWWRLDEVNASNYTLDYSGYSNDGKLYNYPCNPATCNLTDGVVNKALSFDGVDDYIDAGSGLSLNLSKEITVVAWINPKEKVRPLSTAYGWKYKYYAEGDYCSLNGVLKVENHGWHKKDFDDSSWRTTTVQGHLHPHYNGLDTNNDGYDDCISCGANIWDYYCYVWRGWVYIPDTVNTLEVKCGSDDPCAIWVNEARVNDCYKDYGSCCRGFTWNRYSDATPNITKNDWNLFVMAFCENNGAEDFEYLVRVNYTDGTSSEIRFSDPSMPVLPAVSKDWILGSRVGKQIYFGFISWNGSNFKTEAFSPFMTAGGWTHLSASYDGNKIRLYVNGNLKSESTLDGGIQTSSSPLLIGGKNNNYFNGTIDEVRIYNRALSEEEIKQLYYDALNNAFNVSFTMLYTGVQAPSVGRNFNAHILLANGTVVEKSFSLNQDLSIYSAQADVNLTVEGYYPSYGLIRKLIVCSVDCPGICQELSEAEC